MNIGMNKFIQINSKQIIESSDMDYEAKYKKALKEITGVINANRELKEQLDSFRQSAGQQHNQQFDIQKEEFHKAYEKLLKEKNQLAQQNQDLEFERNKLQYSLAQLEEYVSQVKDQQMNLSREKEAVERSYEQLYQRLTSSGTEKETKVKLQSSKDEVALLRQKEAQYHRTIRSYEQYHSNLTKLVAQLEDKNVELEGKMASKETKMNGSLESKTLQIHQYKSKLRKQFQEQLERLRRENIQLNSKITDLELNLQSAQATKAFCNESRYETQLLQTLRQLKVQMEPMKNQIAELREQSEIEREQNTRQKANLKMRVIEVESELQQRQQSLKIMEKKLMKAEEQIRRHTELDRLVKKLEEENRILGGRVIVLESKDIALRNRNGEDLEERILEFQNRVQLLLNEKQNLSHIKSVSIHQLIALKAYILELDSKLKSLVNENEYSSKKYRSYKEKYLNLQKEAKGHQQIIAGYRNKIEGYDRLFLKMQSELERALNIQDIELNNIEVVTREENSYFQTYRRKLMAMTEKLELQDKYSRQELETTRLNYETKLMEANLKLEELKNVEQTMQLYRQKNADLAAKLLARQNQLFDLKNQLENIKNSTHKQSGRPYDSDRQLITLLQLKVTEKDTALVRLEMQIKSAEQQWKRRFSQLEMENSRLRGQNLKPSSPKMHGQQTTIFEMEQEMRRYKHRIAELENELMMKNMKKSVRVDDNRERELIQKVSRLEFELQQTNGKVHVAQNVRRRYQQKTYSLEEEIKHLETELAKQRTAAREKIQEHVSLLSKRDQQLRFQSLQMNSSYGDLHHQLAAYENQNHRLNLELEHLRTQLSRIQSNSRVIGRDSDLSVKYENIQFKYEIVTEEKQRLQKTVSRLENRLGDVETQLKQKQSQFIRVEAQYKHLKIQLESSGKNPVRNIQYEADIQDLNHTITRLNQEVYRLTQENAHLNDKNRQRDHSIFTHKTEYERKIHSPTDASVINLSVQIQRLRQEKQRLTSQFDIATYNVKRGKDQIDYLNDMNKRLREQLIELKNRLPFSGFNTYETVTRTQTADREENYLRESLREAQNKMRELQSELNRLRSESREISLLREENQRFRSSIQNDDEEIHKLKKKISEMQYSPNIVIREPPTGEHDHHIDEISHLRQRISNLQSDLYNANSNYEYQKNENLRLNSFIRKLQDEIDVVRRSRQPEPSGSRHLIEIEELEGQIRRLREDNSRVKVLNQDYLDLKRKYEEKEVRVNQLEHQIRHLHLHIQTLEHQQPLPELSISRQDSSIYSELESLRADNRNMHETILARENQITRLNGEILQIRYQYQSKDDRGPQIDRLNSHIGSLQNQIRTLRNNISQKDREYSSLQTEYNQLIRKPVSPVKIDRQSEIDRLNQIIQVLRSQNSKLRQSVSEKEKEIVLLRIQIGSMDEAMGERDRQMHLLRSEIDSLNESISERDRQMNLMSVEIHQLRMRPVSPVKSDKQPEIQVLYKDMEHLRIQNGSIRSVILERDREIHTLNQENNELRLALADKQKYYQRIESELNQLRSRPVSVQPDRSEYIDELRNDLQLATARRDKLETIISERERQITVISQQLQQIKLRPTTPNRGQEFEKLHADLDQVVRENAGLKKNLSERDNEIDELREELNQLRRKSPTLSTDRSSEMVRLQKEINLITQEKNAEIENLHSQLDRIHAEVEKMHREYIQRGKQRNQLFEELQTLRNQPLVPILIDESSKQEATRRLQQKNQERDREIDTLRMQIQGLNHELSQKDSKIEKISQQINNMIDQLQRLETMLHQREEQIHRLNNLLENNRSQEEFQELKSRLEDYEDEIGKSRQKIIVYEREIQKYNNSQLIIGNLTEENDGLKQAIHDLEAQLEHGRAQLDNLAREGDSKHIPSEISYIENEKDIKIEELTVQISTLEQKRKKLVKIVSDREQLIARLKGKIQQLKEDVSEKDKVIAIINQSVQQVPNLKSEINRLKKRNEELVQKAKSNESVIKLLSEENKKFYEQNSGEKNTKQLISHYEEERHRLKTLITSMETEIRQKEDAIQSLTNELDQIKIAIGEQESKNHEEYGSDLASELGAALNEVKALKMTLTERQKTITQLQRKIVIQRQEFNLEREEYEQKIGKIRQQMVILIQKVNNSLLAEKPSSNHDAEYNARIQQIRQGLRTYEHEIERLNALVDELQEEVKVLRLKLTQMTNQEDRLAENLTTMVLSFAEIEALRDRILTKEEQIADVRKSLIGFSHFEGGKSESMYVNEGEYERRQETLLGMKNTPVFPDVTTVQTIERRIKERSKSMNKLEQLKSSMFSHPTSAQQSDQYYGDGPRTYEQTTFKVQTVGRTGSGHSSSHSGGERVQRRQSPSVHFANSTSLSPMEQAPISHSGFHASSSFQSREHHTHPHGPPGSHVHSSPQHLSSNVPRRF